MRVAVVWIAAVVLAMAGARVASPHFVNSLSLPGTDSQRAADALRRSFPRRAGDADQIVVHGRVDAARLAPMLARVARLPHVAGVTGLTGFSADHRTAFATVTFDERAELLPKAAVDRVIAVARSAATPALQVELGGRAIEEAHRPSLGAATAIGLAAALAVLLVTFGSLTAAALPLVTALLGLGTALSLVGIGTRVIDTPDFSTQLAALLGLGVGVDYALFIVTRFREALRDGCDVPTAVETAMTTAGRAVRFAGLTVIVALLGIVVLGVKLLDAAALASAVAVALTLLAALTVLPVLLRRFGGRIGARRPAREAGFWRRWARLVARRPWPALAAGLAIMLTLAVPALSLRLGQSDAGNDPASLTSRRAYDLLARGFGPGFNGPLQVVAQLPHGARPGAVAAALRATPGVASVTGPALAPGIAVFQAFPRTAPQSAATTDLVDRLRERAAGARLLVGGSTATGIDFADVLGRKLPLFVAIVVLVAGLLLALLFRSLAIPLQAAAMNLLSVAASLGVVVAVFQYGWLGSAVGVRAGPIEAYIPVFLFAIVFGLSMDYEVFLVSRVHEAWRRSRDPEAALVEGLGSTGRVVTAAATIMVCVFVSFVLGDQRVVKLFGLSLAAAVFLDAFVVRMLLLPAVFALLGDRAWALPRLRAQAARR